MAKVNKRMVYHYFGDKAGLYAAALTKVYSRLAEVEADVFRDKPSVSDALDGIVRAYFCLQATRNSLPCFFGKIFRAELNSKIGDALSKAPILDALNELIDRGIASRQIRPNVDRRHMLIHLSACVRFIFQPAHLEAKRGIDLESPEELEKGIQSVLALLKRGSAA